VAAISKIANNLTAAIIKAPAFAGIVCGAEVRR
jgi:hypothetical protein